MTSKLTDLLVVSDIDGTLLQAGYGVPEENLNAIERFVSKGGRFTVCTGRSVNSVRRYVDWIHFTAPAILNNGAVIYDFQNDRVVFADTLLCTAIDILRDIMASFPEIGIELHSVDAIVVLRQNKFTDYHTSIEHIPYVLADIDKVSGEWTKALIAGSKAMIQQVEKYVAKRRKIDERYKEFTFVRSSESFLEMLSEGTNKGSGLKKLAEIMKVNIANTVAIGDYYNDVEMLKVAGYKAVVADAPPDVRALADVTVKSCLQGGVAELLDSLEMLCGECMQLSFDM